MKKIILILLLSSSCFAQTKSSLLTNLMTYIDYKKEPGSAIALSLALPAGGHFYANSKYTPFILLLDLGYTIYAFNSKQENLIYGIPLLKMFLAFHASSETHKYNHKLKIQLNLIFKK